MMDAVRTAQMAGRMPAPRADDGAEHARRIAAALLGGPDDMEHPDVDGGLQARLATLAAQPRIERLRASLRQQ